MKFIFFTGVLKNQTLSFDTADISFGREADNLLSIPADSISRYHGKIKFEADGKWHIYDFGSTNGVKVNNVKINVSSILNKNDVVSFGDEVAQFCDDGAPDGFANAPSNAVANSTEEKLTVEPEKSVKPLFVLRKSVPSAEDPIPHLVPVPATAAPEPTAVFEPKTAEVAEKQVSGSKNNFELGNGVKLFDAGRKRKQGENSELTGDEQRKKRRSNVLFGIGVVGVAIIVMAAFVIFFGEKPKRTGVSVEKRPESVVLVYEKVIGSKDGLFRFYLQLENNQAHFVLDDLKNQRHFVREIDDLSRDTIKELYQNIPIESFWELRSDGTKNSDSGEFTRRKIMFLLGDKVNTVEVVNEKYAPAVFEAFERSIDAFADKYDMQTIAMTSEELERAAIIAFERAERAFNNREAKPGNLLDAERYYKLTVEYLEQFSPKPDIWAQARERAKEAETIRQEKIKQLSTDRLTYYKLGNLQDEYKVLQELVEYFPDGSEDLAKYRRRLFT
ncbi:MAG: FHA domain-containing protein, partial [Victivallaceae bacterium]